MKEFYAKLKEIDKDAPRKFKEAFKKLHGGQSKTPAKYLKKEHKYSGFLLGSFTWDNTKDKHLYWGDIQMKLYDQE